MDKLVVSKMLLKLTSLYKSQNYTIKDVIKSDN